MMKKLIRFLGKLMIWFVLLSVVGVLLFRFLPVIGTPLMVIRSVQSLSEGERPVVNYRWVPYEQISDHRFASIFLAMRKNFAIFTVRFRGGVDMYEAEKRAAETPVRYPQAFLPGTSEKPQVSTSIGVP
jgi:hypothetical protein